MSSTAKIIAIFVLLVIGFNFFLYAYFKRQMAAIKADAARRENDEIAATVNTDDPQDA
jgi:hypothetical protein